MYFSQHLTSSISFTIIVKNNSICFPASNTPFNLAIHTTSFNETADRVINEYEQPFKGSRICESNFYQISTIQEEESMGILSTLLTGGTIVGKICQALAGTFQTVSDNESGTTVDVASSFHTCGVKFMNINASPFMLNTLETPVDVSIPSAKGNLIYTMGPAEKLPIGNLLNSDMSPNTEILIGPVNSASTAESSNTGNPTAVKINFNDLRIGGPSVSIGGYVFSATVQKLIVSTPDKLPTINYLNLRSQNGVSITCLEQILGGWTPGTNSFDFPFMDSGLQEGDVLSGSVHFSLSLNPNSVRAYDSVPLTEAEKLCLTQLGMTFHS